MKWKSSTARLAVVAVVLLTVAGAMVPLGAMAADGPPEPPQRYFGTVTDQGGEAVADVTVQVSQDGTVVAEDVTDSDGYYDLEVNTSQVNTDEPVTISVGGVSKTRDVNSGGSTEVDFTIERDTDAGDPGDGDTGDGDTGDGDTGDGDDGQPDDGGGGQPDDGGGGQPDDDQTTERPTTDQPTTDEPTTDQPTTDGPTTDQPTTDGPTTDGPTETTAGETTTTAVDTTSDDTTGGFIPGFTGVTAVLAVVLSLLLLRRRDE